MGLDCDYPGDKWHHSEHCLVRGEGAARQVAEAAAAELSEQ